MTVSYALTLLTRSGSRHRCGPAPRDHCGVAKLRCIFSTSWSMLKSFFYRKNRLPILLHVDDRPALRGRLVQRLVELADLRLPVVGVFALGIGVVHEPHEARAIAGRGPLQHLQIAVGVSECKNGTTPDKTIDADRLAGAVIHEFDLGGLQE